MTLRTVEQPLWHAFFEGVSKAAGGRRAEVEVASLALGEQSPNASIEVQA